MSTRRCIIMKDKGFYRGIYCHSDEYPEWVGKILKEHYTDENKIRQLLDLGDLSSLGERVAPIGKHSFSEREAGTTTAYKRDRGEKDADAITAFSVDELIERFTGCNCEFAYIFENGEWKTFTL